MASSISNLILWIVTVLLPDGAACQTDKNDAIGNQANSSLGP